MFLHNIVNRIKHFYISLRFPFAVMRDEKGRKYYSYSVQRKISELNKLGKSTQFIKTETGEFCHVTIIYNKNKLRLAKILDWIYSHPIQWLHCFYFYNYYYAIPSGWRKSFGIQFYKELKHALKEAGSNVYKNYRIHDVKEKFGTLRHYDYRGTRDTDKIVNKYEYISAYTCINCGKLATVRTTGWICPYCDNCVENTNQLYIDFGHKETPWYGWTGNINRRDDWDKREKDYEEWHKYN